MYLKVIESNPEVRWWLIKQHMSCRRVCPHTVFNVTVVFEVDFSLQVTNRHFFLKPTQLLVELLEVTKLQKISSPSLKLWTRAIFSTFWSSATKNGGSRPPMLSRHFCTVFLRTRKNSRAPKWLARTQHKPSHFLLAELVHSDLKFAEFPLPKSLTASLPRKNDD